jgi:hypothetical protein
MIRNYAKSFAVLTLASMVGLPSAFAQTPVPQGMIFIPGYGPHCPKCHRSGFRSDPLLGMVPGKDKCSRCGQLPPPRSRPRSQTSAEHGTSFILDFGPHCSECYQGTSNRFISGPVFPFKPPSSFSPR